MVAVAKALADSEKATKILAMLLGAIYYPAINLRGRVLWHSPHK